MRSDCFALQRGAAVIVIVTGALLWYFLHGAAFGSPEMVLAVGIGAAIAAAGVQDASVGSARSYRPYAWQQIPILELRS
jgi:hypothetical protein